MAMTRRCCLKGLTVGVWSAAELLAGATPARAAGGRKPAKACILLWLFGGPSHVDTWDMKPDAPVENRGEFSPIATSAGGIQVCEHLPRFARVAHHVAFVRSVTMTGRVIGDGDHHADTYYMLTGHRPDRSFFIEGINRRPQADDWPFVGSVVARERPPRGLLPGVVQLPARSGEVTGYINPGQFCGVLGPKFEPVMVRGTLDKPQELSVPQFVLPADLDQRRLTHRQQLLGQLEPQDQPRITGAHLADFDTHHQRALSLLTSREAQRAFDITQEPAHVRAKYGNDINGQSVLMARRLVEAGVPFVGVHWIGRIVGAGLSWDTHSDNFGQLKNVLLPAFDACYSALLEDLEERGLLEDTLVVVAAEMGRNPKVGDRRTGGKGPPGRDHWIHCQTALFAGGGIRGGQVYGASDRVGAYPAQHPVYPEDLAATMYSAMGIPSDLVTTDRSGRRFALLEEAQPLPLF